MSNEWHGGKGSKSRVTNIKSYWDSPLWDKSNIVAKDMTETKRFLFLDDVRDVSHAYLWDDNTSLLSKSGIPVWKWDIVRSYDEFVEYVDLKGIPDVVSFDNDLWDVSYELAVNPSSEELTKQFMMEGWEDFLIKTGAHCAEYLVAACKSKNTPIPTYYVHSANGTARPIIRKILENGKL
jgi:hypothetical protein